MPVVPHDEITNILNGTQVTSIIEYTNLLISDTPNYYPSEPENVDFGFAECHGSVINLIIPQHASVDDLFKYSALPKRFVVHPNESYETTFVDGRYHYVPSPIPVN